MTYQRLLILGIFQSVAQLSETTLFITNFAGQ